MVMVLILQDDPPEIMLFIFGHEALLHSYYKIWYFCVLLEGGMARSGGVWTMSEQKQHPPTPTDRS